MTRRADVVDLEALIERQFGLDALLENMTEGFAMCEAVWDSDQRLTDYSILEINPALQRMLGVGPEVVGKKLCDGPGDHSNWLRLCERALKTGKAASFEYHNASLDHWYEIRITRVTPQKMAQLFFDITERKRAELRQASLFDELNHRVSNNLMLVSSILQMKVRETDNDIVRDQLQRADARVQSIAQVHKALYRGARTDVVDFSAYLADLCAAVQTALIQDRRIEISIESQSVSVPVDTAIPIGMVINELVTNAVKYAYPTPGGGPIAVRSAHDGEALVLSIRDFGRGLPDGDGAGQGGGLGMKLVQSLVAQVDGELVTSGPPGTGYEIRVPLR